MVKHDMTQLEDAQQFIESQVGLNDHEVALAALVKDLQSRVAQLEEIIRWIRREPHMREIAIRRLLDEPMPQRPPLTGEHRGQISPEDDIEQARRLR